VHEGPPSLGSNHVIPNPLDHSHVSPMCSQPSFSPEYSVDVLNDLSKFCNSNVDMGNEDNMFNMLRGNNEIFESLGYLSGYDAALDPYYIYLVDKPCEIMWNTFFNFSFDFSMHFSLIKRALIFFTLILCMLSYCHTCEPHTVEFDKLLRALMEYDLNSRVMKIRWSG